MNKTELVAELAKKSDFTRKEAERIVDLLFNPADGIIANELVSGGAVNIIGFGKFESKERAAKAGINPRTKEPMMNPARVKVKFSAGKPLSERVAGG